MCTDIGEQLLYKLVPKGVESRQCDSSCSESPFDRQHRNENEKFRSGAVFEPHTFQTRPGAEKGAGFSVFTTFVLRI